jgi:hypothetical protein
MEIAGECKVAELTDDLIALVRDSTDAQHIRERAAYALEELIPENRIAELIPFARGESGSDPDDTIKGCALRRLIPTVWSVAEALPLIHAPKNKNLYGSYEAVLRAHLSRHLTESDCRLPWAG